MHFRIDPHLADSPSAQIVEQVRFAIAAGHLRAGDRLPSVRSAASLARVNPNTISKAYGELKSARLVELRRGNGIYVTEEAPARCGDDARQEIEARANRLVLDGLAAGLDLAEVERIVQTACNEARERERKTA